MVEALWYKNSVIYCLSVESFQDGNGDGTGDFRGLLSRLDYLHGLGVGAVWLMPFMPSPRQDHGYDVADYYGVDPRFGTLGDFNEFTHGCKQRGIRVLMDMVLNHTSDQHPWFQQARRDRNSPYRDWYLWSDEEPANRHEGMVFPGSQDAVWDYDEVAQAWYFHRFFQFQPDLNMSNPAVREEMLKIMGFWLQLGVSGFRLDAVPFIIDTDEHRAENEEREYQMLREIRAFTQFRCGDSVLLAEANVPPEHSMKYFGHDGDRLHMMFNFPANASTFYALASGDAKPLGEALEATRERPEQAQWCHFLRNHDELDLSILPEDQRERVFAAFAPDEDMRLYGRGIRRRVAPMLGDRRRLELANSLLFSLPGTPVLRYGDEIAMGEDLSLKERAAVRTPMQWNDSRHAGFTSAEEPYCPVIDEGPFAYDKINVERERRDPNSFLNWLERLLRLRRETPEIGYGDFELLDAPASVLAIRYRWKGGTILVAHNFGEESQALRLDDLPNGTEVIDLLQQKTCQVDEDGTLSLDLTPLGYRWCRFGDVGQARAER
jgi:maltose alpha-D-glucosyltransferase/alpha-amylase